MPENPTRQQVGMIDAALLKRVDARAAVLGQTRRVFLERALEAALSKASGGAPAATLPVEGAPDVTSASGAASPAASPRASAPESMGMASARGAPGFDRDETPATTKLEADLARQAKLNQMKERHK